MDISKLSTGSGFHTTGAGNVNHQLSELTVRGKFQNLRGYKADIAKELSRKSMLIKRGGLGYLSQRNFVNTVKEAVAKKGRTLTISEVRNLKEIAKRYGEAGSSRAAVTEKISAPAKPDIEAKLQAKVAARAAVKSGLRPNQAPTGKIVARINRAAVATETVPGSPYNHDQRAAQPLRRSVSTEEARRQVSTGVAGSYGHRPEDTGLAGGHNSSPADQPPGGTDKPDTPSPRLNLEF